MQREKVLFSWSGGKDSALAMYELLRKPQYEVVGLLTTVADEFRRVSHHGVREELLVEQAAALGLPLDILRLPSLNGACTNSDYEAIVGQKLREYTSRGVWTVAHGDLFLADLRAYRERNLAKLEMRGLFPLWGWQTTAVVQSFVQLGFKAQLCCVDDQKLGRDFVGREIDDQFLSSLPSNVDPCGENGEYHSFVYAGPIFSHPIKFRQGEAVQRGPQWYLDLVLASSEATPTLTAGDIPPV